MEKLDILAFAAHPDDVELACSGTLAAHVAQGLRVGIVDLTRGELGTRGTPELRAQESAASGQILQLSARENLDLGDGYFEINENSLRAVITQIRRFQPDIILANAQSDRHPDHGRGGDLVARAHFLSGLRKIETDFQGQSQAPWRARNLYRYIQDRISVPDFVVDISAYWETKVQSIKAYKSQFFDPTSQEPETYISSPLYWEYVEARAREYGHMIGTEFGEGFTIERPIGVKNLKDLL